MRKKISIVDERRCPFLFSISAVILMVLCGLGDNSRAEDRNLPFNSGERLTYVLKWEFIPAGEAVLEVLPADTVNGVKSNHFLLTATSNSFVDIFYKVRDRIDAFADRNMNHSILYKKDQKEGKTRRDIVVTFDWEKNKAQYSNFNKEREPIDILPGSFDPLSAFYYTRLFELKDKAVIARPITDGKKCVIGKAAVIRRETIKIASGTYDTYLVEPDLKHIGGVFEKSKNAKLQLWITADQRRIIVKVKSKVVVGSFSGELVSAVGLKEE